LLRDTFDLSEAQEIELTDLEKILKEEAEKVKSETEVAPSKTEKDEAPKK
jgi:hypothetical protein